MGAYLANKGYRVTFYIFDVELFDRSWGSLTPQQIIDRLHARQPYIPKNSWLSKYHHILIDGWEQFVKAGGEFSFEPLSVKLMRGLLDKSPFILIVNSTYLNQSPKMDYDEATDTFRPDSTKGQSLTHAVTCTGYKDGQFLIIDPEPPTGVDQERWITADHLIASIMAAQTESDNILIAISKK